MPDTSPRLFKLRPLEKKDLESVTHWFQDLNDLALFDRALRIPPNQMQTEQIWEDVISSSRDCDKCWFVIESGSGDLVGMIGLEAISNINRDAVVPVFVDKSIRRQGVAVRAVALMLDFAFRQLGLNRITSYYRSDNHSSRDLISRVGCKIEGTMRQAWFADGQFHDMVVVGMLQQDWKVRRQVLEQELGPETVVGFDASGWSWPPDAGAET
ncbi:Protein N-acetyltransferase, RimJ/RimL family [Ruegeria halocynthiae]|uniref:Protein N-acetyltransferase, RimJ/RimL family n=1 Tax=Ruegeria halocynthiae TaxID=985054 RepID=A0A1H3A3P9_9RHOB|nr:GNAT family protein [Ruegeria halocynthiae]SDX23848.1 Protein N-acetyltransferase, RimJ/RimL family [Ruegeria halocynthiae]